MQVIKVITIVLTISLPSLGFSKRIISFIDRDGDNFQEEKITQYKRGIVTLKEVIEIDSNKDKKVDREITTYFHHDRLKSYEITRVDTNFDEKWDKKSVRIAPLTPTH